MDGWMGVWRWTGSQSIQIGVPCPFNQMEKISKRPGCQVCIELLHFHSVSRKYMCSFIVIHFVQSKMDALYSKMDALFILNESLLID